MQHCPTAAALSASFLLNHAPQQLRAEHIDYKIQGAIQQREYESWVKNTGEIKQQLVEFWQCANTARENVIFVFPVLSGNAEAEGIWAGIAKGLLIPYFIGNISAKKPKISKSVHVC